MSSETPVVHLDINLRLEVWNEVYDLLGLLHRRDYVETEWQHEARVDVTEELVSLVRRYAPIIMAEAQGQAHAEQVIGDVLARMSQPELDKLLAKKERQP